MDLETEVWGLEENIFKKFPEERQYITSISSEIKHTLQVVLRSQDWGE